MTAMTKRRVPAALHHELTEYASLLRALRVRDAMDITKHITNSSPFSLEARNDEELNSDDDLDDDEEASHRKSSIPPTSSPTSLGGTDATPTKKMSAKARGKRKAEDSPFAGKRKQRRRDHWTRWPVPLEDVLLPEWTLEDEVAVIASQVIKLRPPPVFPVSPAGSDEMDDEEGEDQFIRVMDMEVEEDDPDIPFHVPYLTSIVAEYLSTILGLLASFTPARAASMQNRIEPLGWRTIIDVVVTCGIPEFTNAKVIENVTKRMERIYGPSFIPLDGEKATSYRAVERINTRNEEAAKFEQHFERELSNYFRRQPSPLPSESPSPVSVPIPKQKRSRPTQKEEATYKAPTKKKPKQKDDSDKSRKGKSAQLAEPPSVDAEAGPSTSRVPTVRRSERATTVVTYREVPPE